MAATRCPDCQKFVSLELQDPELETLDIADNGTVTASIRIVRACADCGTELKEATLEMENEEALNTKELEEHTNKDGEEVHSLEIEETGLNEIEEQKGKTKLFGAEVAYVIVCACDEKNKKNRWEVNGALGDKISAADMDDMT